MSALTYNLDQLLALIKMTRDKIAALQTERPTDIETQLQILRNDITEYIAQANRYLKPSGCTIIYGEPGPPKPVFIFHYTQPLDNIEVSKILGVEIIGETCHFQIIDEEGRKAMRCAAKTPYIMDQIAQHSISIEAIQ